MKPPVDRIRVSRRSRGILQALKRRTGITHWNVLCRWAFLDSLANPSKPPLCVDSPGSNLEMTWPVFAGELSERLLAVFMVRASRDEVPTHGPEMAAYFRDHLERGIRQLRRKREFYSELSVVLGASGRYAAREEAAGHR